MIRILISLTFLISIFTSIVAQENIQNLENKLKSAQGKERFTILYDLTKAYLVQSPKKSIDYGKKAIEEAEKLKDLNLQSDAYNLVGTAYYKMENYKSALKYYEEELVIRQKLNQESSRIKILFNIGSIYEAWDKLPKAVESYQSALDAAQKAGSRAIVFQCYESIIRIYHRQKDFKNAYEALRQYMAYKTSNNQIIDKIAILETQYNEEKKANEENKEAIKQKDSTISLVKGENEYLVKDSVIKSKAINTLTVQTEEQKLTIKLRDEEVRRQRQLIMAFILFIIMVLVFSILLYKQYRAKKKAFELLKIQNAEIIEQKEEIQTQADQLLESNQEIREQKEEIEIQAEQLALVNVEITKQRDEIQYQQAQIKDSIRYASRIQNVMLPQQETLDEVFNECMVLWRPQEIVSGDFYWVKQIKNFVVFAAADCTGHGVPGAFMSMLGISFLNEIVSKSRFDKSNEILNLLRKRVKNALNQTGKVNEATDGMDIALCVLDTEYNILQFSGAYNPLYLIRDNELQVIKSDHQPIAIYPKEKDFTYNELQVKKGDVIYIFSDGFMDQFGGVKNEKLKTNRFKQILLDVHSKPMTEQKNLLNSFIEEWMGTTNHQIDDILIFGIKI
jgi:serine phosphatase RsbU (regulator of sigma subunit)